MLIPHPKSPSCKNKINNSHKVLYFLFPPPLPPPSPSPSPSPTYSCPNPLKFSFPTLNVVLVFFIHLSQPVSKQLYTHYVHIYMHTDIHTCTYVYIHVYTHIYPCNALQFKNTILQMPRPIPFPPCTRGRGTCHAY